jgi:hypothetical protein
LDGISISSGDEHLIRTLPQTKLQKIIEFLQSQIEPVLPNLTASDKTMQLVKFTNGLEAEYPNWMINRRGHDLLPVYQSKFQGPRIVTPPRLMKVLQRVRLIPKDLAELMAALQKG